MNEERQRVLRMLKAGRITVEEAEALLEALGEEQEGSPPGRRGTEAGQGAPGEFQRLIDDIVASIDVEGIVHTVRESVGTVRESLLRSKAEVHRICDEVRRAARCGAAAGPPQPVGRRQALVEP